jgi:23S rRNA pseudouridine1911/1915/1917 synthase
VVGDSTYGGGRDKSIRSSTTRSAINSLNRQFLHATRLELINPRAGELLKFESRLPADLDAFLRAIV